MADRTIGDAKGIESTKEFAVSSYHNPVQAYNFIKSTKYIDLPEILARHSTSLLLGQGVKLLSENDSIRNYFDEFSNRNKLNLLLNTVEKLLSKYGRIVLLINKDENDELWLDVADPMIINKRDVLHFAEDGKQVTLYKWITVNDHKLRVKEVYDEEKVEYFYYFIRKDNNEPYKNEASADELNKIAPKKDWEKVWYHGLGVLPLEEFINVPYAKFYTLGLTDTGIFPWMLASDDYPVRHMDFVANEILRQSLIEMIINKTRAFGNFSQKDRNNLTVKNQMGLFTADFLIDSGGNGQNAVEISTGAPKLQEYDSYFKSIVGMYFKGSRYSWSVEGGDGDATQTTVIGNLFTKSSDVETTKTKRQLRTDQISRLMEKILKAKGLMSKDSRDREFAIEIAENNIINETQLIDNIVKQIDAGLLTRIEAIAKLRALSPQEAEQIMKQIDKERENDLKYMEKQAGIEEGGEADEDKSETDKSEPEAHSSEE